MIENRYCLELVRKYDPDRFLLSLLAPRGKREALWALFAFNHEIAKTREVVSETATGLIRLQWWRDAVCKIYNDDVLAHEVVKPLARAIETYDLPQEEFDNLIYAREFDVEDRQPANMEGFLKYCEFTSVPLTRLVLKVLGQGENGAEAVSVRYAALGLVRAMPFHMGQRRCYMPEAEMKKHGASVSKIYDWNNVEGVASMVEEIVLDLPEEKVLGGKYLRAMNRLSDLYERQLKRCGYNPFDLKMEKPPMFKELRVMLA
jgi:NADH dehydrogenase [ubiquinone] 1 alpha subcomplex assembly factor 6